jgi:hypothetical protein
MGYYMYVMGLRREFLRDKRRINKYRDIRIFIYVCINSHMHIYVCTHVYIDVSFTIEILSLLLFSIRILYTIENRSRGTFFVSNFITSSNLNHFFIIIFGVTS